ncbi:hypothetical protein AB0J52_06615 [Spirillospora sp. NPDC049652]
MTAPTPAPPATSEISLVEAVWRYRLMSSLIVVACVLAAVAATAFLLGGATATARFAVTDPTNNNNVLRQGVVSGPGYAAYTAQRAAFAGSAPVLGRAAEIIKSKKGPALTAAALRGRVKTSTKPDSGVVIVSASGGDMPEAALIANAVVQAYQEQTIATATAKLDTQLKNIQNSEREITRSLESTPASTREGRVLASQLAKLQSQESGVLSARANANSGVQFVDNADPGGSTPDQLPQNAVIGLAAGAILACVVSFLRATSGGLRLGGPRGSRPGSGGPRIERVWADDEVYGPASRPALPAGNTSPNPVIYPDSRHGDAGSRHAEPSSRRGGSSRSGETSPRHVDTYPRHGDTSSRRSNPSAPATPSAPASPAVNGSSVQPDVSPRTSPSPRVDGTASFGAPSAASHVNGSTPRSDAAASRAESPGSYPSAPSPRTNGTNGTSAYPGGTGSSGDTRVAGAAGGRHSAARPADPLGVDPLGAGSRSSDVTGSRSSQPARTSENGRAADAGIRADASDLGTGTGFGRAPELGASTAEPARADGGRRGKTAPATPAAPIPSAPAAPVTSAPAAPVTPTTASDGADDRSVASGRGRRGSGGRSRSGGAHSRGSSREDGSFRDPAKALETGLASTPPRPAGEDDRKSAALPGGTPDGAPSGKDTGSRIPVDLWSDGTADRAADPGRTVEDLRIVDDETLAAVRREKAAPAPGKPALGKPVPGEQVPASAQSKSGPGRKSTGSPLDAKGESSTGSDPDDGN